MPRASVKQVKTTFEDLRPFFDTDLCVFPSAFRKVFIEPGDGKQRRVTVLGYKNGAVTMKVAGVADVQKFGLGWGLVAIVEVVYNAKRT